MPSAGAATDFGRGGDVGKGTVAVVAKELIAVGPGQCKKIQVAVVIDVDERGGLRHVRRCRDARRCRDVFEPPVGLLPEEPIASGAKDEEIRPAVIVVVGGHSGDRSANRRSE